MELFSSKLNINFMKYRFAFIMGSVLITAFAVFAWIEAGSEKYGIDFSGGTEVVVAFDVATEIADVRRVVEEAGLPEPTVQQFEGIQNEFSIRTKVSTDEGAVEKIRQAVEKLEGRKATILKQDFVGPVIGDQIKRDGLKALLFSLCGIMIYLTVRFEFRFALGAIVALFHDAIVAAGFYVLSGRQLNAAVIAAILTIIGYSVNDSIVVYDRIRENMVRAAKTGTAGKTQTKYEDFVALVNASINQTMSRTMLTSLATLFMVFTLWQLGGGVISDFALTLFVGILIGTYSSVFVASPLVIALGKEAPALRNQT